jgi:hypothetical protein
MNHQDTKGTKPTHPPFLNREGRKERKATHPITQRRSHPPNNAEAQRRRGVLAVFHRVARSRPSDDGREPQGRTPALNASDHHRSPTLRPALFKRRPRHLSSSFNAWEWHAPLPTNEKEKRQNRRAQSASAGEKTDSDGCSYPELAGFSPATGDYRSPVVLPPRSGAAFHTQRRPLGVGGRVGGLAFFARAGGWAAWRFWVGGWLWVFLLRFRRVLVVQT